MRILHILDHSLPLQSGYVFRTMGILREQREMGWHTLQLTTPKHYANTGAKELIGEWEFHRTTAPDGVLAKLPVVEQITVVKPGQTSRYGFLINKSDVKIANCSCGTRE